MSTTSAGQWVKFFNASGIPSPIAATYAHIFVENRIKVDMLMDLNKEYLREMGVTLMGDIIAILRHAKEVSEQTAREKVLFSEVSVPIAAIPANPVAVISNKSKIQLKSPAVISDSYSSSAIVAPLPKQPRRVLPEHEGKYKIKLPSGTTVRSKEILAKKAKLYADIESSEKPRIFDRLDTTRIVREAPEPVDLTEFPVKKQDVKISLVGLGTNYKPNSSIFSRLGGKSDNDVSVSGSSRLVKPILKNSQKTSLSTITKAKTITTAPLNPKKQKVLLVQKVPLKKESKTTYIPTEDSESADEYDESYDCINPSPEKIVKFASQAEVRSFRLSPTNSRRVNESYRKKDDKIHLTRKTAKFKQRIAQTKGNSSRLKSDEIMLRREKSIHSRLGNPKDAPQVDGRRSTKINLSNRIGKLSLTSPLSKKNYPLLNEGARKTVNGKKSSVFDRLGFTG